MTLLDLGGIVGVAMVLLAYAGVQVSPVFDPKRPLSLSLNLVGSGLILLSMTEAFNLSAFLMEAAWAAVAAFGLLRVLLRR